MSDVTLAAMFAVFIWWFSTGIVLLLNRLSRGAVSLSLLLSSLLGISALVGLAHTAQQSSVAAAYCAFTCALLVWGWHELSFLTGWVTGPRKTALPQGLGEGQRFIQAVRAILWHEIGILVVGVFIAWLTWGAPNQVGSGTFFVLWAMRTSAKLNLYFGVRNLSEQFLPAHLSYMQSFFRRRAGNWLLPFVLAGAGFVLALMVNQVLQPDTSTATVVGITLVATMLALAIVEHLLLVLPFDTTALWRWALREAGKHRPAQPPQVTEQAVFLPSESR